MMAPQNHLPPQWRERLLALLAAKVNPENLRLLSAWQRAEGGNAVENPLNTTRALEGSTAYNDAGVRNYRSADDPRPVEGIAATAITLAAKYRLAERRVRAPLRRHPVRPAGRHEDGGADRHGQARRLRDVVG
jgi:hypothetical protein